MKKRFFLRDQEYSILNEIFSEIGISVASMLLSGRSTKRRNELENEFRNKIRSKKRMLEVLENRNFITIKKEKVYLTRLGEKLYKRNKIVVNLKNKNKKWDGVWRMVSFDIPNEYSDIRNLTRRILLRSGFLQIQKSVYIYPHKLDEIKVLLGSNKILNDYIIYANILNSTAEEKWKKHFKNIIR